MAYWYETDITTDIGVLSVSGWIEPVVPGKTWGNPETCYPDEGGFAELEAVTRSGACVLNELTDEQMKDIKEAFYEAWEGTQ